MDTLKEFSDAAISLSRNPLGIIALFIVLVYGVAALVAGASRKLTGEERTPLIWFLALFPCLVLAVFGWLVSRHHDKLYAPSDYKDESHFVKTFVPVEFKEFNFAEPSNEIETSVNANGTDWPELRKGIYDKNNNYFLTHVIEPSNEDGQLYDIFIYVIKHKSKDFEQIEKAEFFFGKYWGNKVFAGTKVDDYIGVRTAAYGPFLAVCKLTLKNGQVIFLNRYVDFEMGKYLTGENR